MKQYQFALKEQGIYAEVLTFTAVDKQEEIAPLCTIGDEIFRGGEVPYANLMSFN